MYHGDKMKPVYAKDARNQVLENLKETSLMSIFFEWVKEEIKDGHLEGNFFIDGEHFSEDEEDYIRNTLGYKLIWNGACLWYEVSW